MRHIVGLASVMLTFAALTTLHAAAASIEGSWIGSGTVGYRGTVDQVRCRVRYTKGSEKSYAVSSVCATENRSYEINGRVTNTGGNRYRGTVTSGNESGRRIATSAVNPKADQLKHLLRRPLNDPKRIFRRLSRFLAGRP